MGIHFKLIQFENSKKSVYRLELPNKKRYGVPTQVGLVNLTKYGKDLFVITGHWFYHYQEINNEYKIKDHFEFENIQLDAYVKDFNNYNTIAISTRMLPPGQDMNKWTVKTNDTIIKGALPDYDYPNLLRFIPRQPYDIFENKVLISNILKGSYYIVDKEILFTDTDSEKMNKINPFVEIVHNGKSKVFHYEYIFEDDLQNSIKKDFIKALKENYSFKLNEDYK